LIYRSYRAHIANPLNQIRSLAQYIWYQILHWGKNWVKFVKCCCKLGWY